MAVVRNMSRQEKLSLLLDEIFQDRLAFQIDEDIIIFKVLYVPLASQS